MLSNPFEALESRLNSIESLLLEIRTQKTISEPGIKDFGGVDLAVEETNLSKASIYQLVHRRAIPHSKKTGRLYFSRRELREWIKSGSRKIAD